jgi:hypothetical protein
MSTVPPHASLGLALVGAVAFTLSLSALSRPPPVQDAPARIDRAPLVTHALGGVHAVHVEPSVQR